MAFRFVRSAGSIHEPATVEMYASGVVRPGMVVEFLPTAGQGVSPGSASTTYTAVFGVCLDYAQGASDVRVRVIPIVPGQIWEADTVNAISTAQIGLRQKLYAGAVLLNNNSYDETGATGIFHIWEVTGSTSGSGKVLGSFVSFNKAFLRSGSYDIL